MSSLMNYSETDEVITAFKGAIETRIIGHPKRAFAFEVLFHLSHPRLLALGTQKPPLHFHPYQKEYVQVIEGRLVVEVEGKENILDERSGEFCIRPWSNHRLFPVPGEARHENEGEEKVTKFLLSGEECPRAFRLDKIFFENWYAYQDLLVVHGEKPDILQMMCMFDAGASYLALPWWVPFGHTIALVLGVLVGRCLAGLLGYRPYHKKWTKDWQLACEKMETFAFYRRSGDRAKRG